MNNLDIWEKVRKVPTEAKKTIKGGRLNGMTDINPVWRIKTLTEQFGTCGFGWKYTIESKHLEQGDKGQIAAFVDISLFINLPDKGWSDAIPGTGGSMFVVNETNGPHTSDECFKMALTDALSVSCKALGIGADVYWEKDSNKYDTGDKPATTGDKAKLQDKDIGELFITPAQVNELKMLCKDADGKPVKAEVERLQAIMKKYNYTKTGEIMKSDYDKIMNEFAPAPFEV